MTAQITFTKAAALAQQSYQPNTITGAQVRLTLNKDDVQAVFLTDGTLLLPGSDGWTDYIRFNLRLLNLGGVQLRLSDDRQERGVGQVMWHQGFLTYAKVVVAWLGANHLRPTRIVGHSLGAAAAQILCKLYTVPTIAFAAPRPKASSYPVQHNGLCVSVLRRDDPVTQVPLGFSHLGKVMHLPPPPGEHLLAHNMKHYVRAIDRYTTAGVMPTHWPR
jgi:hypothetical protein